MYVSDHFALFLKGLEQCVHLEELILNDNLVKKIEGLDKSLCASVYSFESLCDLSVTQICENLLHRIS